MSSSDLTTISINGQGVYRHTYIVNGLLVLQYPPLTASTGSAGRSTSTAVALIVTIARLQECSNCNSSYLMMWVGSGLTSWFHGVPTVMTRGACQILGRVAGQFSHFFQVERHMDYTRNMHFTQVGHRFRDQCDISLESARLRKSESEKHLAYPGVVSVSTSDPYKWLYLSWERLLPLFSFTVGISASVRVRMMYAGVSDPHLPQ
ncbi:hypothetical protein PROFUN_03146, partial [Planoprotostelium fungivorum]